MKKIYRLRIFDPNSQDVIDYNDTKYENIIVCGNVLSSEEFFLTEAKANKRKKEFLDELDDDEKKDMEEFIEIEEITVI